MTVDPITIGAETAAGVNRVLRGAAGCPGAEFTRVAYRSYYRPFNRNDVIGFRLAATCKAPAPVVQ